MDKLRAGRLVLTFVAAVTGISPFLADWNETHIHSAQWPPYAKFQDGQKLLMGARSTDGRSLRDGGTCRPAVMHVVWAWVASAASGWSGRR